jgi:hypothetical protein
MSTIGDIVGLLEKIPTWKRLKALPDQFEALQVRVAALEAEIQKRPPLEACPLCGSGNLKVTSVKPHPSFGPVGIQERVVKCDNPNCNHTEKRIHDPVGRLEKNK